MKARRFAWAALLLSAAAQAELPTEVRVYDDDIVEPGEFGFEIHTSRTLRRSQKEDESAGKELASTHGLRLTPEISYGLNAQTEISLLLPTLWDERGMAYLGGQQLQLKWLPIQAGPAGGWFAGVNWEWVTATRKFDAVGSSVEMRPIVGYRNADWRVIANLLTSYGLTEGHRYGGPAFKPAFKLAHSLGPGWFGGVEYYADLGKLARFAPRAEQQHTLYATLDVQHQGWKINFGLGRGLNGATDPWIVKSIIEFPLDD